MVAAAHYCSDSEPLGVPLWYFGTLKALREMPSTVEHLTFSYTHYLVYVRTPSVDLSQSVSKCDSTKKKQQTLKIDNLVIFFSFLTQNR